MKILDSETYRDPPKKHTLAFELLYGFVVKNFIFSWTGQ